MEIEKLFELAKTPEPFTEVTQEIWLDPDRSDLVLVPHFDENIPGDCTQCSFIQETVNFINNIAQPNKYKNVIDVGCGPGLYSQKLAMKGYDVVGIDFNKKAIERAISDAEKKDLSIDYRLEDIT